MKRFAVIPTGNRKKEYLSVIEWCKFHDVTPITIATSDEAEKYAKHPFITNRELNISLWWNKGIELATDMGAEIILVLNDDVILPYIWLDKMEQAIRAGFSGASGLRFGKSQKISGYAFALNPKDNIRADEELKWYYTDDYIEIACIDKNGFKLVSGLSVENKYARSSEQLFGEQIKKDMRLFRKKYL